MMTDKRLNANPIELEGKITPIIGSYIGITRHVAMRIAGHRREKDVAVGHKSTNKGRLWWQLELVIGPVFKDGKLIKQRWRKESRKTRSRIAKGLEIAIETGLQIYARDPKWIEENFGTIL